MKTIKQIKDKIKEHLDYLDSRDFKDLSIDDRNKESKKVKTKVEFLRIIEKYLELNPTKEFCESELERLNIKMGVLDKSWLDYYELNKLSLNKMTNKDVTKVKNNLFAEFDIKTIKKQIETLKFILQ